MSRRQPGTLNEVIMDHYSHQIHVAGDEYEFDPIPEAAEIISNTTGVLGSDEFVIAGDLTSLFVPGWRFEVVDSTANDGIYTVVSSSYDDTNTTIVVAEATDDDTGDGSIFSSAATGIGAAGLKNIRVTAITTVGVSGSIIVQRGTFNNGLYDWADVGDEGYFKITPGTAVIQLNPLTGWGNNYLITATGTAELNITWEQR